jgi:hypothetical protein
MPTADSRIRIGYSARSAPARAKKPGAMITDTAAAM